MVVYKMGHNSLYDRINKLLVSYEWSDCRFSVCGQTFKAHKLILGISSPVFEAMFYGPLSSNDDIIIVDVEPHIFQLLLNYIYTDKIEISSIEEAYDLLYVSRKYMLEYLSEICIAYIDTNLNIDNVVTVLNYPEYMQVSELVISALKLACQHAHFVLRENKKQISLLCMRKVLETSEINISEKDLIKFIFEWTKSYCDQNNMMGDFDTRRNILLQNDLLRLLRFKAISLSDLEEIIALEDNLLIQSEIEEIKRNISQENELLTSNILNHKPRSSIKLKWCLCHRAPYRSESPITIEPHNNEIKCRVKSSISVFVNSLSVQSRMAPGENFCANNRNIYPEAFTISITCESDNNVKIINYKNDTKYDSSINVDFSEPMLLKRHVWYNIKFLWCKESRFYSYSYAVQSRDRYYTNGKIQFDFEDISPDTSCGSFLKGLKFCM